MKLVHSMTIDVCGGALPSTSVSGFRAEALRAFDFAFQPDDSNHFLVATDGGACDSCR